MKHHIVTGCLVTLGLCLLTANAGAQADTFKINYFANNGVAGAPDATVRIDNPGTTTNGTGPGSVEGLCAMIYVFDNDQQLSECCGCLVTPDGLRTLSVRKDLTSNPLTGVVPNNGVIEIVSTFTNDDPCVPTGNNTEFEPTPSIRAWATHIQNKVGSAYPITETPFTDATSGDDFESLLFDCQFAIQLGSGHGVCSCGTGD